MSILVLLETLIIIKKNVRVSFMLFYVQYQIPQLVRVGMILPARVNPPGDKNISILHLSYWTSDLQLSLILQNHAHVL